MGFSYEEAFLASKEYFNGDELGAKVFVDKYALRDNDGVFLEKTPRDMHERIAKELARIEAKKFKKPLSYDVIFSYLDRFKKISPQGSILFGLGNEFQTISLSNCYVLETPGDSYGYIHRTDEQLSHISKRRGGCGLDISELRPDGAPTSNSSRTSTGIIPFLERYSNSIREVGQCIEKNQRVITKRSGSTPIKDVLVGDFIWTKEGWIRVKKVFNNGIKEIYKITSERGYSLLATKKHILLNGNLIEKSIEDISIGEDICLCPGPTNDKYFGQNQLKNNKYIKSDYNNSNRLINHSLPDILDEDLAYLIGYSYGDGYVERYTNNKPYALELACSHDYPSIEEKLKKIILKKFGYECKIRKGSGALNSLRIFSTEITNFLLDNDLLKGKGDVMTFPLKIKAATPEVQAAFISGYFDADGDIPKKKSGFRLTSINKEFLSETQKILINNGIHSRIVLERTKIKNWKNKYRLCITGSYTKNLTKEFLTTSEKISKKELLTTIDRSLTPYSGKQLGLKKDRKLINFVNPDDKKISCTSFLKLKQLGLAKQGLLIIDKIITKEKIGYEETYDLELEEEHLFACEGFYVHNSGRRGALMVTLNVHHPEVLNFARVKLDLTKVTGANISIRLTDEFLNAVENKEKYQQRWPVNKTPQIQELVDANYVWDEIIKCAHQMAEPGLIFWDNILRESPADCYKGFGFETVSTNPCSELPLSELDSCRLLILNLFAYVKHPYTSSAYFDFKEFYEDSQIVQRLMDDIVDAELEKIDKIIQKIESDPEPKDIKFTELYTWQKIKKTCENGRRTGTGGSALGDTIAAVGLKYGSEESLQLAERIYKTLKFGCYRSSIDMAKELGPFPVWNPELEKDNPFLNRFKDEVILLKEQKNEIDWIDAVNGYDIWSDMQKYGRRNIAELTSAPVGSISILLSLVRKNNVSSGIEPCYKYKYKRRKKITHTDTHAKVDFVDPSGDKWQEFEVYHPSLQEWLSVNPGKTAEESPWYGACAEDLDWTQRVELQSRIQKHIDHAISSTINLPENVSVDDVKKIYEAAWKKGLKGITVYRNNCRTGVLVDIDKKDKDKDKDRAAEKRPKSVPCNIHHLVVKGVRYYVLIGLYNETPYEVFVGRNTDSEGDALIPKSKTEGLLIKEKRGYYKVEDREGNEIHTIVSGQGEEHEEALARMTSTALRHNVDIGFVVSQLEKTRGGFSSFAKSISRTLKTYIPDGTPIHGSQCSECQSENLIREGGCSICKQCGASKCL